MAMIFQQREARRIPPSSVFVNLTVPYLFIKQDFSIWKSVQNTVHKQTQGVIYGIYRNCDPCIVLYLIRPLPVDPVSALVETDS